MTRLTLVACVVIVFAGACVYSCRQAQWEFERALAHVSADGSWMVSDAAFYVDEKSARQAIQDTNVVPLPPYWSGLPRVVRARIAADGAVTREENNTLRTLTAEQQARGKLHLATVANIQLEVQVRIQSLPEVQAIQTEARKTLGELQQQEQALEKEFIAALSCADGWDWQAMDCTKKPKTPKAAEKSETKP